MRKASLDRRHGGRIEQGRWNVTMDVVLLALIGLSPIGGESCHPQMLGTLPDLKHWTLFLSLWTVINRHILLKSNIARRFVQRYAGERIVSK